MSSINHLSMVSWGWGSLVWGWFLWVDSGSLIGDISNKSVISIGGVLDVLDSAIRKSNGVRSSNIGSTIGLFLSIEAGLGVVISNSVGVGVWGDLIGVGLDISSLDWGMVSWGWGMISWGSVDSVGNNWGSVDDWGVDSMGNNWGSVDGMSNWGMDGVDSMGDNGISSVKSVGGISNNSSVSAESLALGGGSVFSLVWLADRLMADLSVSISIDWSVGTVVHWGNGSRDWGGEDWGMDSGMVSNSVVHQTEVGTGGGQNSAQTQESLHVYLYVLSE